MNEAKTLKWHCKICNSIDLSAYKSFVRSYLNVDYKLDLKKCNKCNFIFLANPPDLKYDESYLENEGVITSESNFAKFHAIERLKSISKMASSPGKNFLDIGIGDGLILKNAEDKGFKTFGLDVNEKGVELARKQYGIKATVSLESYENSFNDVSFDVIHLNEVIEHIEYPLPLLKWCYSKLNRGGIIVIQTGNINSLVAKIKGEAWDYVRPVHVSYFSEETLSNTLQTVGFKVINKGTVDWRFSDALNHSVATYKSYGISAAVKFFMLYTTALLPRVRRTTLQTGKKI